ncbi:hypothetical protein CEXT_567661 [Caerostris extrusa]|uniref:Uncharacterized protein n=1 Tax=Caerostris extrusa TaxID=172846 RepID=A0AAV4QZX7_CAEEX|nr:hypothetical protein CEXT_567661 [Caerostris extrusa]
MAVPTGIVLKAPSDAAKEQACLGCRLKKTRGLRGEKNTERKENHSPLDCFFGVSSFGIFEELKSPPETLQTTQRISLLEANRPICILYYPAFVLEWMD